MVLCKEESELTEKERVRRKEIIDEVSELGAKLKRKLQELRKLQEMVLTQIASPVPAQAKTPENNQETKISTLADMKPPSEENGRWFSVEKTEEILNDILILKKTEELRHNISKSKNPEDIVNEIEKLRTKQLLAKSTLRTRREGASPIHDEQTGFWHGKDTEGVFFRFARQNRTPEYFILEKKDTRFPREYPKLVDSASGSPPPEVEFLKKLQK